MSAIRILPRTLFFGCILLSCVGLATGDALAQVPCSQSDPAVCDGGCPAGEQCFPDVTGGPCRCLPTTIPCEQSPFPECGGECPSADLVCAAPPGAANCECLPAVQACEQGPFPECGGECPPDHVCTANANLNECVCEPIVIACEQTPFPICDGECPADQACEPIAGTDVCRCGPIVVPCEQGPFPECGGECPTATHCEPTGTTVNLPSPDLPPEPNPPECDRVVSMYEGQDVHALFPNGIDFSNPIHKCFQNVVTTTQGQDEFESFNSVVEGVFDDGSGPTPIQLVGPVVVKVSGKAGQSTGSWDTEMVSMSLTGEVGGIPVEIRESPNKPSAGQTTVTDNGDGTFFVDSFFDVFTEISVDGGPFEPQVNPPGRLTLVPATPGTPDTCECVPDVVPCEQGPFPECGGECPADQVCTANTALNECACEPIVVPCEQSPYPECGGECQADQVCEPDASGLAECACVPIGQECSQCGAGPHFVDQCGPFPPVGIDLVANNSALVSIDVDMDCVRDVSLVLRPCPAPDQLLHVEKTLGPIDDSVNFPGTSPVDGHPTGPGLDVIDTEIVSLCLTNGAITLAAGVGGPSVLPLQPSLGAVAEDLTTPDSAMADSFFDVFFEVSGIAGGPVYNQTPLQVQSRIDCLPPAAGYRHPAGICIPLTTRGICSAGPNANAPCVSDLDCPDGACDGTLTLANLVSALHTVNVPVCDNSPFPECGGECPPDEECRPSTDGTDACRCEPIPPVQCEQGPFPECGGECPADQACEPIAGAETCRCVPIVVPCEQSPHPECGGECPLDQVCEPIAGTAACGCVPIVVPCEQSPHPECGGECPADQVCEPDASGLAECACVPIGQECSQCGAGPHFVDQCGPFPPVGTDLVANNTALVGIDVDMDCVRDLSLVLRPCPAPDQLLHVEKTLGPIDDSVNFPGTSPVDGHPTGPGLDVIDTEIVSLCLTNGAITLAAGVGGPSVLPLQPSLGAVAEDLTTPDSAMADSFFDVFFEVSGIAGGPVYNQTPLQVQSRIDCLPPAAGYRHPAGICIPLTTRGICSAGPNANAPCVSDLDCPDGACAGTLTLANLVSALHTVNVPVCDNSPYPECGGECPPDEECRPSTDGTDACRCEPIPPVQCEQGPFPECGGECPPDQVCSANPNLNECVCEPIFIACEQSPFPVCDGECPADQVCEPIAGTTVCRCVPVIVPCEQSPHPECGGECPLDQVCEPIAGTAACGCVPIVVPCEQSPHPECGGECPADQVCEPDASGLAECACVPIGQECSQCGAGPHFVDQCGPFPPVGTDLVANNTALVGIDVDMDCVRDLSLVLRPCPAPDQLLHVEKTLGPIDDSVNFPGTSPVDGHPTGPGLDVIDTEIVSLCLTNGAITLAAGVGGPSVLPLQPSLGAVAEDLTTPDSAMADSFFDVFFEVSGIAGGPVYNQTPLQVQSRIDCLPPAAGYRHPAGICIPLTTRGICSAGPNANAPCVSDLDCPDGACDGTLTLANLVSALHTVNVPVCDNSPFPECGGECPPEEECRPSTDGTDACRCEPIPPVQCEQGPFPECGGECPADQACTANPNLNECVCEPIVVACEQSPFPECGGECPADQACEPIAGTTVCRCVPVIVPCEQGPFPECGGECPTDQVCTEDPTGVNACVCEPIVVDCEATPYPTCDGECPPDQICLTHPDGTEACVCEPIVIPCEQSPFPICDGECPPGLICEPDPDGGNSCTCVPPPVPCDESSPPVCDGFCPDPQQDTCVNIPGTDVCDCRPCLVNVPGHNIDMRFVSRDRMQWIGVPCAFVYNVYRFAGQRHVDANNDGLADDYGSCLMPDLLVPSAVDTAVPPSGSLLAYLVTGESSVGEGSMGFASNLLQRPNNNPCP